MYLRFTVKTIEKVSDLVIPTESNRLRTRKLKCRFRTDYAPQEFSIETAAPAVGRLSTTIAQILLKRVLFETKGMSNACGHREGKGGARSAGSGPLPPGQDLRPRALRVWHTAVRPSRPAPVVAAVSHVAAASAPPSQMLVGCISYVECRLISCVNYQSSIIPILQTQFN